MLVPVRSLYMRVLTGVHIFTAKASELEAKKREAAAKGKRI